MPEMVGGRLGISMSWFSKVKNSAASVMGLIGMQWAIFDLCVYIIVIALFILVRLGPGASFGLTYGGEFSLIDWRWVDDYSPFGAFWTAPGLNWEAHSRLGADGLMNGFNVVPFAVIALAQRLTNIDGFARAMFIELSTKSFGVLTMYALLKCLVGRGWGSVIGAFCYAWNSYFVVGWHGGQYPESLGGSLVPLFVLGWVRIIVRSGNIIDNSIMMAALCAVYPTFAFMATLICFALFISVYWRQVRWIDVSTTVASMLTVGGVTFFAVCPWLLASVYMGRSVTYPYGYNSIDMLRMLSKHTYSFYDALSMNHPFWPGIFSWKDYPLHDVAMVRKVVPVVVTVYVILFKRSGLLVACLGLFFASGFLAKGSAGVAPEVNEWVFSRVFGFDQFRSSSKFAVITAFSCSVIVAFMVNEWSVRLRPLSRVALVLSLLWLLGIANVVPIVVGDGDWRPSGSIPRLVGADARALDRELAKSDAPARVLVVPWGGVTGEKSSQSQYVGLYHLAMSEWSSFIRPSPDLEVAFASFFGGEHVMDVLRFSNVRLVVVPRDIDGYVFGRDEGPGSRHDLLRLSWGRLLDSVVGLHNISGDFGGALVWRVEGDSREVYVSSRLRRWRSWDLRSGIQEDRVEIPETVVSLSTEIVGDSYGRRLNSSRFLVNFDRAPANKYITLAHNFSVDWRVYRLGSGASGLGSYLCRWSLDHGAVLWWLVCESGDMPVGRELDHMRVNGFGQAWAVGADEVGSFMVEFGPQRAFDVGWLIALFGFGLLGLVRLRIIVVDLYSRWSEWTRAILLW